MRRNKRQLAKRLLGSGVVIAGVLCVGKFLLERGSASGTQPGAGTQAKSAYDAWVGFYGDRKEDIAELSITQVEERGQVKGLRPDLLMDRAIVYHFRVGANGRTADEMQSPMGVKGGDGSENVSADGMAQLTALLAKLPDDGFRLPPVERRMMLQYRIEGRVVTRVYDRGNLSEDMLEVLRLSRSFIGSWTPNVAPTESVKAGDPVKRPAYIPKDTAKYLPVPDAKRAVVQRAGDGDEVLLWDVEKKSAVATLYAGTRRWNFSFSPDESMVALAYLPKENAAVGRGEKIEIFSTEDGTAVHELRVGDFATPERVSGMAWTADGKYILAATDECISVWDPKTGRQRGTFSNGQANGVVQYMAILSGNKELVALWEDGKLQYFDLEGGLKQMGEFEASMAKLGK